MLHINYKKTEKWGAPILYTASTLLLFFFLRAFFVVPPAPKQPVELAVLTPGVSTEEKKDSVVVPEMASVLPLAKPEPPTLAPQGATHKPKKVTASTPPQANETVQKQEVSEEDAHMAWWRNLNPIWRNRFRREIQKKRGKLTAIDFMKIKELEELNLGSSSKRRLVITDLNALRMLTKLRKIDLSFVRINDLSALSNLTDIEWLDVRGTEIENLKGIENLENLKYLDLSKSKIKSLAGIENCKNLEVIHLAETSIADFSPLAKLRNLKEVDFSGTSLAKLDILIPHTQLEIARLSATKIQDLRGLEAHHNLKEISLYNLQSLPSQEVETFKAKQPACKVKR